MRDSAMVLTPQLAQRAFDGTLPPGRYVVTNTIQLGPAGRVLGIGTDTVSPPPGDRPAK